MVTEHKYTVNVTGIMHEHILAALSWESLPEGSVSAALHKTSQQVGRCKACWRKVQLAIVYVAIHMLFGCVAWGHSFGMILQLCSTRGSSSVGKLDALHCDALRWTIAAPPTMRSVAIYLMSAMILLYGLIPK